MESECVRTSDSRSPWTTARPRVARMSPPAFLIVVVPTGLSIVPLSRMSDDPRFSISIVVGVTVRSIAKVSETLSVPPTRSTCGSPPDVTGTILLICRFLAEALTIRIFSRLSENFQVPPLPEMTSAWSDAWPGLLLAEMSLTFSVVRSLLSNVTLTWLATTPFAPISSSAFERPRIVVSAFQSIVPASELVRFVSGLPVPNSGSMSTVGLAVTLIPVVSVET